MYKDFSRALLCASGIALMGASMAYAATHSETNPNPLVVTSGSATESGLGIDGGISRDAITVIADSAVALSSDVPFAELSIANPTIADISTISSTSIYVLGKRPGRTTLMLLGSDSEILRVIDVRVSPDVTEFRSRLSELLPNENIDVVTANDGIVLLGSVRSQSAMDQALELARHYATGEISNLIKVEEPDVKAPDFAELRNQLDRLLPDEGIEVEVRDGNILLLGEVSSDDARRNAIDLAESYAAGRVTSLLTVEVVQVVAKAPDIASLIETLAAVLPNESVIVYEAANSIILSGSVSSEQTVQQALEVARLFSEGAQITNMLSVAKTPSCFIRTRRGAETVESSVRCNVTGS